MIDGRHFSVGKYSINGKLITLTDSRWGFQIKMQVISDKTLNVISGFAFIKNKKFELWQKQNRMYLLSSVEAIYFQKIQNILQKKQCKKTIPLKCGVFYDNHSNYKLVLNENYEFLLLFFENILVASGKWSREDNVLSLFDENLNHPFYMLITENGLKSQYLPADYEGVKLYLKK
jgi:hypothetical protein